MHQHHSSTNLTQDTMLTTMIGQIGRSLGPLVFCTLYWWAGRDTAYSIGGAGMLAVCALVFGGLKMPPTPGDPDLKDRRGMSLVV